MDLTDGCLFMGRKLHICDHPEAPHIAHTSHAPSLLLSVQSRVLAMPLQYDEGSTWAASLASL
jgi:hypothetical protein